MYTTSVLIPSFGRAVTLQRCLQWLAFQSVMPDEVIVVWQGEDADTRDAAYSLRSVLSNRLRLVHSSRIGIVPAENAALEVASGDIILLLDDDAIPPQDWLKCHLSHYDDPLIGAVGGPADNFRPDGIEFPRRHNRPVGCLTWFGKIVGNMYDQDRSWRSLPSTEVDHLVGYNLSFRRCALDRFEDGLKPYWQLFELDACLQAKARGYRILFDFSNVVRHFPTNTVYAGGRDGDLNTKVYHAAFNHAFVLAKHSPLLLRAIRLLYLLAFGSVAAPGLIGFALALWRYGRPARELSILWTTWYFHVSGWRAGCMFRVKSSLCLPRVRIRPPKSRVQQ